MTQSHIAIGLLIAAKSGRRAAITGAILGGIAPDFMMVPMVLISSFVLGQDMGQIWSTTYYGVPWWNIDQIANSGPLYALLAGISVLKTPCCGDAAQVQHCLPSYAHCCFSLMLFHLLKHAILRVQMYRCSLLEAECQLSRV